MTLALIPLPPMWGRSEKRSVIRQATGGKP
jgi:hypothetical protein